MCLSFSFNFCLELASVPAAFCLDTNQAHGGGPYGYAREKALKDAVGRKGDEENASWRAREERAEVCWQGRNKGHKSVGNR